MPRNTILCFVSLMVLLAACNGPRDVTVVVSVLDLEANPTVASSLPLVILPYDRDSLLDLLERQAARPRPHVAVLDSLFAAFRVPYLEVARAARMVDRYRDSMTTLKAAMDTLPREDEAYRFRFQLFAQLSDSLERSEARRERATTALRRARRTFVPLSDSLRQEVRVWEETTFDGYDSLVTALADLTDRTGLIDTTDSTGHATMLVGRGAWWVYARAWDVEDPNSEWYWNVQITGDTVRLDDRNGRRLPTY
ncbi:MAG: hypothetical protein V3S60_11040 [Acidimicrobiia bacterium]